MKNRIYILVSLIFVIYPVWGKSPTRVVAIALDGICVEGLKKANTPNIDKLMAEGVVSWQTRNVMPSVTLPNWTSHLTGSGPEQHGVTDNKWTKEKHILSPIDKTAMGIIHLFLRY